jgi:predicted metallopeptidase
MISKMSPEPDPRPDLTPAIERVLLRLCALPALEGIDARRVVVVAHGAHGSAAASVRSLVGSMKRCTLDGDRRLVELCLRPPFFLDGDAPRRLATLAHELLHLDRSRAGALLEENRHARRSHASLEKEARAIANELLEGDNPLDVLCLAHDGEVLMRQWRVRPGDSTRARTFGDRDVFTGPVRMRTPARARGGWW